MTNARAECPTKVQTQNSTIGVVKLLSGHWKSEPIEAKSGFDCVNGAVDQSKPQP